MLNNNDNELYSYTEKGKKLERKLLKKEDKLRKKQLYKQAKKRPVCVTVVLCFLCVILAVSGSAMIYYYNIVGSFGFKAIDEDKDNNYSIPTNSSLKEGNTTLDLFDGTLLNDPKILNVMLFGEDSGVGSDNDYGRSDTMIMLSIDMRHKEIKITSFMRDMLVTIPTTDNAGNSYGMDKLNAAYSLGGAELSVKTIESNFGVDIDRYAIVNFKSFTKIVDTLGGIDINLTQDEIDYINWQTYINKQSTDRYEIKDKPGLVHLNGRQALWYSRNRGYQEEDHPEFTVSGDDFDRTSRQRNFLRTLMERFKKASLTEIVKIVGEVGPMVTTNLKKDEITTLVANSLTYLSYDVKEFRLPTDNCYKYSWYMEQSVLEIIDIQTMRTQLAKFIFGEEAVVANNTEIPTDEATEEASYTGYSDTLDNEENSG